MKQLVIKLKIMKKSIFIIANFTMVFCMAQNPILTLNDQGWNNIDNAYYQDNNNVLDDFEGIWLYENDNTSLKIELVKSVQYYNGKFYEDILIGGYQYIENGEEVINTLSDASDPAIGRAASIRGNNIYNNCVYLPVNDCVEGELNLDLSISDVPANGHIGSLRLFKRNINGQEALKAIIEMNYYRFHPDGNLPDPTLPWYMRNIMLIKQN